MPRYEYTIVPAPDKALKIRGLKSHERFAATVEQVMNEMGAEGWQYLRADTLQQEERTGLTGKTRTDRILLVFQREIEEADTTEQPAAAHPAPPTFSRGPAQPPLTRAPETTLEDLFDMDDRPEGDTDEAPLNR